MPLSYILFCQTRLAIGSSDHQLKIYGISVSKSDVLSSGAVRSEGSAIPDSMSSEASGVASVLEYLGAINRPHGRGRATQLMYAVDVDDLANDFKTACVEGSGVANLIGRELQGTKPDEFSTRNGTLLIGTSTQVASKNSRQILLLVCPNARTIEAYREYTPQEQLSKFKRRKKRAMEKLKKKQSRLEEVRKFCESLDSMINRGQRTAIGTTYDSEKEASMGQVEDLTVEIDNLLRDSSESQPNVSDQFQYVHTFYLKNKPVSIDCCCLNWSVLVSFGDNKLQVLTLPLDKLLVKKVQSTIFHLTTMLLFLFIPGTTTAHCRVEG